MPSKSSHLCERCLALKLTRDVFARPSFELEDTFDEIVARGTIGELRSRQADCGLCRMLLEALSLDLESRPEIQIAPDQEWEAEWHRNTLEYDPVVDDAEDQCGSGLYPRLKGETNSNYGVQLIDDESTQHLLRAREIPLKISITMINSWLARCNNEHGNRCLPTYLTIPEHPSKLPGFAVIDVEENCLAKLPDCAAYTTLSYVWGTTNYPMTVKANVEAFEKPGAFMREKLPKTIRDAMEVSSALGFRFLWVDSLCIVQDDDIFKKQLISNMDAVYGNSALTVVAASSDHADSGLQGWGKDRELTKVTLEPGFTLGVIPFFDLELTKSKFASRGWTYQEAALSPRKIVFLGGRVYFVCRGAVWREDVVAESDLVEPAYGANALGNTPSEWPLGRYADHATAYSYRQLTYPSDGLNAFSGMQNALQRSMAGTDFWHGLPAAAFDWALLWNVPRGVKLVRRDEFPSWSWAGWSGSVVFPPHLASEDEQDWLRNRTWIEWYIINNERVVVPLYEPPNENETGSTGGQPSRKGSLVRTVANEDGDSNSGTDGEDGSKDDEEDGEEEDEEFMPTYGPAKREAPFRRMTPMPIAVADMKTEATGKPNDSGPKKLGLEEIRQRIERDLNDGKQPRDQNLTTKGALAPGTLVFETQVCLIGDLIEVSSVPVQASGQESTYPVIMKKTNKICGQVSTAGMSPQPELAEGAWTGFLALSFAGPSTVDYENLRQAGLDEEYLLGATPEKSQDGEEFMGEWHEWDFFNVMLVHGHDKNPPRNAGCLAGKTSDNSLQAGEGGEIHAERRGLGLLHRDVFVNQMKTPNWRCIALG